MTTPTEINLSGAIPVTDKRGRNVMETQRAARLCAEVFANPDEFKTKREWIEALDETLTDLARAFRYEPKVSLVDAWTELTA